MKILGVLAIFLRKQAIKGIIDFEKGEVLKIFGYVFNRQGFFIKSFAPTLWLLRVIPFSLYRKL
jgi:hypothetical protein